MSGWPAQWAKQPARERRAPSGISSSEIIRCRRSRVIKGLPPYVADDLEAAVIDFSRADVDMNGLWSALRLHEFPDRDSHQQQRDQHHQQHRGQHGPGE